VTIRSIRHACALLFLGGALAPGAARADGFVESAHALPTMFSVAWDVGLAAANLGDVVPSRSLRGVQGEVRRGIARHLSLGLGATWNWFAENRSRGEVRYASATVTGPLYERARFVTIRGTAHWYVGDGPIQPYVGAGIGAVNVERRREIATASERTSAWSAVADPQVGVLWTVRRGFALHVQAHRQISRIRSLGVDGATWSGVAIGLAVY
jgi:hypothetical protein